MANKLELKSSHEVIDTVDVADVESIFYCKPTDPDILTVLMKDGKRLYCDEVCPINSLQEEPASEDLNEELEDFLGKNELLNCCYSTRDTLCLATKVANHFVNWQKQQMMKDAVPGRISVNRFGNKVVSSWPGIQQLKLLHTFDKVKLIIIKED